ncbi:branched-chain amino acid ABC transporter substrate-binding protein, partial [Pseudomonas ogarae]
LKIIALAVLGIAAFALPAFVICVATPAYISAPFSQRFIHGYLPMDTLGSLLFCIVIVNASRSRGVASPALIPRYAIIAGLIAGVGLALV